MPWRETTDPYCITVSEIMLQQTQVQRVAEKYPPFISTFPDWRTLASAPQAEVLKAWQGLGYNRRGLYLKKTAEEVIQRHNGILPSNPEELEKLPGIGKATAAAISTYAFNTPTIFIETNIRSVFIHHFFPKREKVDDKEIMPLIAMALDKENPREWYWALMDYGSNLKKSKGNPSRKSKHHIIQKKFTGSEREARGAIIKALTAGSPLTLRMLARKTGIELKRIQGAVPKLMQESFVKKVAGKIFLA